MLKSVFAPHLGCNVFFGRRRPVASCPKLRLRNYLLSAAPTPPNTCDYSPAALQSLRNIDLNNQLGDCVIAMGAHLRGVTSGNAGALITFTQQQIIAMYSAIGGYVPGVPSTDQGCDEQTALNYWTQTGFPDGIKLSGWVALDATNQLELMTAVYLFENVLFGVELPDPWINPFPSRDGFIWDTVGPADPNNGHAFNSFGYSAQGLLIDTWALFGTVTWRAAAQYAAANSGGELYTAVSPDMIAKASQKAPNGLDWAALIQDFDSVFGGNIPQPIPVTPPSPVNPPTPVNPPGPVNPPAPGSALFTMEFPKTVQKGARISFPAPVIIPAGSYELIQATSLPQVV